MSWDREASVQQRQDALQARKKRWERAMKQLEDLGVAPGWQIERYNAGTHWQLKSPGFIVNFWPSTGKTHAQGPRAEEWRAAEMDVAHEDAGQVNRITGYRRIDAVARRIVL